MAGEATLHQLLKQMVEMGASDLHLTTNSPPMVRLDGRLIPLPYPPLTVAETKQISYSVLTDSQKHRFEENLELDFSFGVKGLARFRANNFMQRGAVGGVYRQIPYQILGFRELGLPPVVELLCDKPRGLILVTGPTGSGKTTTQAAMIDKINREKQLHIITIEDPIEFLLRDKKSIINQRELGVDTETFVGALKSALRQDPDVILVGEMRDFETIETAIMAAETGHLVLSTLHTLDATETINRIISAFPPYQQKQVRLQLGSVLKGVISQRLVPRADGKGRVPAIEVLLATGRVRELIEDKERTKEVPDAIAQGHLSYGMQTFDQSLMGLLKSNLITYDEALRQATNPDDFALRVSGVSGTSDLKWESFERSPEGSAARRSTSSRSTRVPTASSTTSTRSARRSGACRIASSRAAG
ncbi:MAG TPA: type IV pilus twitching motility protein PilT, partial [Thermoanaerobaculia bacterium]|nr:type IV pilus twitching motility protein PilT [Thermoanaerobaculia bacterium]